MTNAVLPTVLAVLALVGISSTAAASSYVQPGSEPVWRDDDVASSPELDIQAAWFHQSPTEALFTIQFGALDLDQIESQPSWSGRFDLYEWNRANRLGGEWSHDASQSFWHRSLAGGAPGTDDSPREVAGELRVHEGTPGFLQFAFASDLWTGTGIQRMRTVDVTVQGQHADGASGADSLRENRENPLVPGPGLGLVALAVLSVLVAIRRRPNH
jgi:hypothetical protein